MTTAVCAEKPRVVDNPAYQKWAGFEPGSYVKTKSVTEKEDSKSEVITETTLLEVYPNKVKLEVKTISNIDGKMEISEPQVVEHKSKMVKRNTSKSKVVEKGREVLTINEEEINTTWETRRTASGLIRTLTKTWESNAIPGGIVQSEMQINLAGAETKTTLTLQDYKAEKK